MNRRDFAYLTAFAGLVSANARAERPPEHSGKIPAAAGLITEMTFLDDCVRLAMYDPEISKAAKTALTSFPDFVHNGTLSPPAVGTKSQEAFALTAGRHCSAAFRQHRKPDSAEA